MATNKLAPPLFASGTPRTVGGSRGQREREADELADRLTEPRPADSPPGRGFDLSDVRVHTDSLAATSARQLHAAAYSVGRHIVFGAGQFRPYTHAGRRLIAHELAHLTQPDAATVVGRQDAGVALAPDAQASESERRESDAGTSVSTGTTASAVASPRPDFVFIMGADRPGTGNPFFREAERFYRAHLPTATIVTSVRNLADLLSWISSHASGPVGNIYIVTHANEDGTVSFGLDPADEDARLTVQELRSALHPTAGTSAFPRLSGQVDAATRIHIKGCDLGRTQVMVELIDEAFGGEGTVTAPTHEQEYGEDPVLAQQARRRFEAEVASGHPAVPGIDPGLRGVARRQAQQHRQQALAQRARDIRTEIASRRTEEGQFAVEASRYEAFSGPMFQRPGTEMFTRSQLSPLVAAEYPQLSARQQAGLVSRLVARDARVPTIAQTQGTFRQQGQRLDRRVACTYEFDDPRTLREARAAFAADFHASSFIPATMRRSSNAGADGREIIFEFEGRSRQSGNQGTEILTFTVQVPDDATLISRGQAEFSNPERYSWRVLERHATNGKTTKEAIAERVITYLHHASLDPAPHEHFTRPEDDPRFFATSTFTPPAPPPAPGAP